MSAVDLLGVAALGGLDRQGHAGIADRGAGDLRPQTERQPLFRQHAPRRGREFGIHARQNAVEELDDGDLRAQSAPHAAEFQADHAGANDNQMLRHLVQFQRAGRCDDAFLIDIDAAQRRRFAAGGDDDVLRFVHGAIDLDLAGCRRSGRCLSAR